jgi:hypothetical protein
MGINCPINSQTPQGILSMSKSQQQDFGPVKQGSLLQNRPIQKRRLRYLYNCIGRCGATAKGAVINTGLIVGLRYSYPTNSGVFRTSVRSTNRSILTYADM